MFGSFDPNGGDLGYGKFTSIEEFHRELPLIALALREIQDILKKYGIDRGMKCKYGFTFPLRIEVEELLRIMNHYQFPHDVRWYEVEGRKVFEVRGPSGGIVSGRMAYLIAE